VPLPVGPRARNHCQTVCHQWHWHTRVSHNEMLDCVLEGRRPRPTVSRVTGHTPRVVRITFEIRDRSHRCLVIPRTCRPTRNVREISFTSCSYGLNRKIGSAALRVHTGCISVDPQADVLKNAASPRSERYDCPGSSNRSDRAHRRSARSLAAANVSTPPKRDADRLPPESIPVPLHTLSLSAPQFGNLSPP